MLAVFLEVVLPVALVALLGGAVGRWRRIPISPVSALTFYLFSPALVFDSMSRTEVSAGASIKIVGVLLASFVAMYVFSMIWSLIRRHNSSMRAAFALSATTPNAGNMGLPVAQLAFGEAGLQVAVVNFVASAVLTNSAGIAIASMAGGSKKEALLAPFRYPSLYAAALGVAVNVTNFDLPITIESPMHSLAGAAVPTMLVVLGLQLQHAVGGENAFETVVVNISRLLIAPGVAYIAATAFGFDGVSRGTLVVLAAMPTAVIATILATEFGAMPQFVTRVVVTSTLACMVSLTLLITLLR